jgi:hypothetical protein
VGRDAAEGEKILTLIGYLGPDPASRHDRHFPWRVARLLISLLLPTQWVPRSFAFFAKGRVPRPPCSREATPPDPETGKNSGGRYVPHSWACGRASSRQRLNRPHRLRRKLQVATGQILLHVRGVRSSSEWQHPHRTRKCKHNLRRSVVRTLDKSGNPGNPGKSGGKSGGENPGTDGTFPIFQNLEIGVDAIHPETSHR